MTTVIVERAGTVARITLNRPDKLNAFTEELHQELFAALGEAEAQGARAVLLTGAGRGFCAGQDLNQRKPGEVFDSTATLKRLYNPLIRRIRALPMPVVCAVNGVAAGAGVSLALACDVVLAARSATFLQAFARLGLVPDSGATWMLPRLIGDARARGLALLAEKITAEQALSWGLIWQVHDDDKLMAEASALATRLGDGPTAGYAKIKQAFAASADNTLDQQLDLEAELQGKAAQSADFKEGVAAFLEKRGARFTGR